MRSGLVRRLASRLSTGARLGVSFAVVLGLFAFALVAVLHAMSQLERADREDAELDRAKHMGHRVSALLREQYIHQAHTIIEWNRSHLDHYKDVAEVTRKATAELVGFAHTPEEQALAAEVATLVQKNHDDFMNVTLPAIDRDEHDDVVVLHRDMEKVVVTAARKIKALNASFEARSDAAHALADRERRKVRLTLVLCFGAAALFAAIVALLTTRWIGARVRQLRDGVRRVGDGDLSARIGLEGHDELAGLASAVDEMATRLERHQRELVQAQKLASMGRLCAGVAHEINGPLGIILGYASVIREQGADDEALRAIEDEAHQCQRIVQALLDMSRQETPRFTVVDLAQLARDGVDRLRATEKLGRREVDVRGDSVEAYGDEAKLRQVLLNLVANAVEATPTDGHVTIEVAERGRRAFFAVEDDGLGVSAAQREHLFEPFATTKEQGTGLGLAISRAIVEAHRGDISVAPRTGGGTRVEVTLELAREHGPEALA
jgi:signal transduction histidine kinase